MNSKRNDYGRGYEYACLKTLYKAIKARRRCKIDKNSSYYASKNAWDSLTESQHKKYLNSAASIIDTLFELEPLITEDDGDILELKLQPDFKGIAGDVRDIIILRSQIGWEIGLSIKHNHFAVKHSRLSKTLDFSEKWFGRKCSSDYWNSVSSIFEYLSSLKQQDKKWNELTDKNQDVYLPLLTAFIDEIKRQNENDPSTPKKMVEYLLGEFDFYKVINLDEKKVTRIQTFNLHGTLNKPSEDRESSIDVPIVALPTRIVSLDFKPDSSNTVEMYLDKGWQFSFRIHNASSLVETSLKLDVQIIGMPTTILTIDCKWDD